MHIRPLRFAFVTAVLVIATLRLPAQASAQGIVLPSGFNLESAPGLGPVIAILADGRQLIESGGFPRDALAVRLGENDMQPFAVGFVLVVDVAQSPVTGDIVVADPVGQPPLCLLRDLNRDGDALDAGENAAYPVALPVLSNGAAPQPSGLAFRPGTDELYVSGSTPFGIAPTLGVVVRIANGAASVWADGLGFAQAMAWSGDTLYVADVDSSTFAGRVVALTDGNADGDALDPGEAVDFSGALEVVGLRGLVAARDGTLYVSGISSESPGHQSIGRMLPDHDGDGHSDLVEPHYFDGFTFTRHLILQEGAGGFVPGVPGDGTLTVEDVALELEGNRLIHSAPFATLSLEGEVKNHSAFTLRVGGRTGAGAVLVLSTDPKGITLPGIGDLALGFGAPHLVLPLAPLDAGGGSTLHVAFHAVDAAVGLAFTAQGFTLQSGEVGLSNALAFVIGS